MMKLAWRFKTNLDSLWAKVLRFKYIKDNSTDFTQSRLHCHSPLWGGILKNSSDALAAMGWVVGNGKVLISGLITGLMLLAPY